jgi:hypothetical protein
LQVFNKNYVRIPIRIIALGVALALIYYYLRYINLFNMLFWRPSGTLDLLNEKSAHIAAKVYLYFILVIYMTGLPHIISTTYFLIICRAPQSNLWGLLIVGFSIFPVHFVVIAGTSDDAYLQNTILQFIHMLIILSPIVYWKKKGMDEKFLNALESSAQKV